MANPTADFPGALHVPIDISLYSNQALGLSSVPHTQVHGKIESELVALGTKLGYGLSTPDTGKVLYSTGLGISSWVDLNTLVDLDSNVLSVNGKSGVVVLTTSDIAEGTNEYYTSAKVQTVGDARYVQKTGDTMSGKLQITQASEANAFEVIFNATMSDAFNFYSNAIRTNGTLFNINDDNASSQASVMNISSDGSGAAFNITAAGIAFRTSSGSFIVNENGGDYDTRFEGDTNQNLLFIDASTDRVGIGTNTPGVLLSLGSSLSNTKLALYDNGGSSIYGLGIQAQQFRFHVDQATSRFSFLDAIAGNEIITLFGTGAAVFNEPGAAVDFRVEGDTDINTLFIKGSTDRVGIGNNAPTQKLEVTGSIFATSADGDVMLGAQAFPNKVSSTDSVGVGFEDSGWATYKRGMFTEVDGAILSYGINVSQQGNRDTTVIGGIFRLDTRSGVAPYFSVRRQVIGGSSEVVDFQITPSGRVILGPLAENVTDGATNTIVMYSAANAAKLLTLVGTGSQSGLLIEAQSLGAVVSTLDKNGALILNEQGADADTRFEGDTDQNLFFLDASTDRIGIGQSVPNSKLHIALANGSGDVALTIQNNATTDGETSSINFQTTTTQTGLQSQIRITRIDAINQSMMFLNHIAGTPTERLTMLAASLVINETGFDSDFRVEGDTDANLFFLDASTDRIGIGKNNPAQKLDVVGNIGVSGTVDGVDVSVLPSLIIAYSIALG